MKIEVSPANGRIVPLSSAALSIVRSAVEPTATTLPPLARTALSASAVSALITACSACILWSDVSSAWTGRNVPGPTCSVTLCTATPRAASFAISSSVKCRPAVGAATEPSSRANRVW